MDASSLLSRIVQAFWCWDKQRQTHEATNGGFAGTGGEREGATVIQYVEAVVDALSGCMVSRH